MIRALVMLAATGIARGRPGCGARRHAAPDGSRRRRRRPEVRARRHRGAARRSASRPFACSRPTGRLASCTRSFGSARRTTCSCRPISSIRATSSRKASGPTATSSPTPSAASSCGCRAASKLAIERDGLRALSGASAYRHRESAPRAVRTGRRSGAAQRRRLGSASSGKLVLGENVAQAAQFVQSGAADAGIIAQVARHGAGDARGGRFVGCAGGRAIHR